MQMVVNNRNCLKLVISGKHFTAEEADDMKDSLTYIFGGMSVTAAVCLICHPKFGYVFCDKCMCVE